MSDQKSVGIGGYDTRQTVLIVLGGLFVVIAVLQMAKSGGAIEIKNPVVRTLVGIILGGIGGAIIAFATGHTTIGWMVLIGAFSWLSILYAVGQWEDKVLTIIIGIVGAMFVAQGYWYAQEFGMSLSNPFIVTYLAVSSFFFIMVLVSRFSKKLNLVDVISAGIVAMTGFMVFFTFGVVNPYLNVCKTYERIPGVEDPWYISLPIYLGWIIGTIALIFGQHLHGCWKFVVIAIGAAIYFGIASYAGIRCQEVKNVEADEPRWVDTSQNIALLIGIFTLVTGHNFASVYAAAIGFGIIDRCRKTDPRKIAFSTLIFVNIVYGIVKYFSSKVTAA